MTQKSIPFATAADPLVHKSPPAISVIVPVYNTEKYLSDCLDSLIGQTFQDLEILCVDDGSCDNSAEILKTYAEKYPRIRIFSQKNTGPGMARNTGLRYAEGTYIMFCDSDDIYDKDMCRIMFSAIHKRGVDLVKCKMTAVYPSGERTKEELVIPSEKGFHLLNSQWRGILCRGVWDKIFRLDIIRCNNIYFPPVTVSEDISFLIQYAAVASTCFILPDNLYYYYVRRNSTAGKYETDPLPYQNDILISYQFTLRFLLAHSCIKSNSYILFHLANELTYYWKNEKQDCHQFFRRIKQEILFYFDRSDISSYPLLEAINNEKDQKAIDILQSLHTAWLLGIQVQPNVRFVKVS
ncbi:glycosyltransferase [Treponema primitia]|uniref:glycosyltransferase n=1 Tax=Treponema primitia TaxID=88058 RepID=UPI0002554FF7|nr:glycosyltransferase [Treponema primitia]